jgi:hypothetical protein
VLRAGGRVAKETEVVSRRPAGSPQARVADEVDDTVPLADYRFRSALGLVLCVAALVAVCLAAADAPAQARTPFVLVAALGLPAFPFVATLRLPVAALVGLDIALSLAIEAAAATVMVKLEVWHPQALGLALAALGVGGTLAALTTLRHRDARHLQ